MKTGKIANDQSIHSGLLLCCSIHSSSSLTFFGPRHLPCSIFSWMVTSWMVHSSIPSSYAGNSIDANSYQSFLYISACVHKLFDSTFNRVFVKESLVHPGTKSVIHFDQYLITANTSSSWYDE